jgi:hypothetical protein
MNKFIILDFARKNLIANSQRFKNVVKLVTVVFHQLAITDVNSLPPPRPLQLFYQSANAWYLYELVNRYNREIG